MCVCGGGGGGGHGFTNTFLVIFYVMVILVEANGTISHFIHLLYDEI